MKDYQQRVVDEKKELDEKIDKLTTFLEGETFKNLDVAESDRLMRQRKVMVQYSQILNDRIRAFE